MKETFVLCTDGSVVGPFNHDEMSRFEKAFKLQPKCRPWANFFSEFFRDELDGKECKHIWNEVEV